jgi:hypothetical protein
MLFLSFWVCSAFRLKNNFGKPLKKDIFEVMYPFDTTFYQEYQSIFQTHCHEKIRNTYYSYVYYSLLVQSNYVY